MWALDSGRELRNFVFGSLSIFNERVSFCSMVCMVIRSLCWINISSRHPRSCSCESAWTQEVTTRKVLHPTPPHTSVGLWPTSWHPEIRPWLWCRGSIGALQGLYRVLQEKIIQAIFQFFPNHLLYFCVLLGHILFQNGELRSTDLLQYCLDDLGNFEHFVKIWTRNLPNYYQNCLKHTRKCGILLNRYYFHIRESEN